MRDLAGSLLEALATLPDDALDVGTLGRVQAALAPIDRAPPASLGWLLEGTLGLEVDGERVVAGGERRRAGAHFTPAKVADDLAARALAPLLATRDVDPRELRVLDPAVGAGAFLLAAGQRLAGACVRRGLASADEARRAIAARALHGVDRSALAVRVAAASLARWAGDPSLAASLPGRALQAGDATVGDLAGLPPVDPAVRARARARVVADGARPLDWARAFPEALAPRAGFDAVVGNPPWISYAGRAAQPLDEERFAWLVASCPAFRRYRSLQAVFVHRAALLVRPGGRVGLVLPTSTSDLGGYAPVRATHDRLAAPDPELPDYGGGGFDGVFQPCMGLVSTRRAAPREAEHDAAAAGAGDAAPWPLARGDLDDQGRALLDRLAALPRMPAHLFGERGFHSTRGDLAHMRAQPGPAEPFTRGIREGGDIGAFRRGAPGRFYDPALFAGRMRDDAAWASVRLLVRQTARFPVAAMADGAPFRNSILAGFEDDAFPAPLLLAWLNTSVVRCWHWLAHRDARQGMPQVKVAHLRALPAPPEDAALRAGLAELGARLAARNDGAREHEQAALDDLAMGALDLPAGERARVERFRREHRVP